VDKIDFAGLEVSAQTLLLELRRDDRRLPQRSFPNDPTGHRALVAFLVRPGRTVRVCLESTGVYGLDAALVLAARPGIEVMVANPRSVHHFGRACMQCSKTDPIDAALLAEFAARMKFVVWQPPALAVRHLCTIARRLTALGDQLVVEKNHLHAASATHTTPACVRRDIERSLANIVRARKRLLADALRLIQDHELLHRRYRRMIAVPGLGPLSAVQILAELGLVAAGADVRQVTAYAGLDPREYSSGSSVHKKTRISKTGNRHLRRALYMPALVAVRHQPHFGAFYRRLLAAGKPKMVALTAAMRKLLHALWAMIKHDQDFDATKLFQAPPVVSTPVPLAAAG